jgi:hypothetical protein
MDNAWSVRCKMTIETDGMMKNEARGFGASKVQLHSSACITVSRRDLLMILDFVR